VNQGVVKPENLKQGIAFGGSTIDRNWIAPCALAFEISAESAANPVDAFAEFIIGAGLRGWLGAVSQRHFPQMKQFHPVATSPMQGTRQSLVIFVA
jgi:hypothetical protein